jgi:hypothetical protein
LFRTRCCCCACAIGPRFLAGRLVLSIFLMRQSRTAPLLCAGAVHRNGLKR